LWNVGGIGKELLSIIKEKPTRTEPFVVAEHLEHIRDWKSFITPYLRSDELIGTCQPHHFRFFMEDNIPRVQSKMYARTPRWEPEMGYACLDTVPSTRLPIGLAEITEPEPRDIKVLEDYIDLKERQIARHQNVEKNIDAVEQTEWLISYLKEFPTNDRTEALQLPFWPLGETTGNEGNHQIMPQSAIVDENILTGLPQIIVQAYWGPRSLRPSGQRIRPGILHQNRPHTIRRRSRTGVETLPRENHAKMSMTRV
jgi:hypothetical protein